MANGMMGPPVSRAGSPGPGGMFGFGAPTHMNLLNMGARMLANSGGSPGQPGMGFGQGAGAAMLGAMGDAQQIGQLAYRNKMMQKQQELAEKEAERAEKAREQAAEARRRQAEIDTQRWVAGINAETQRAQIREQGEQARHKEILDARVAAMEEPANVLETIRDLQQQALGDPADPKTIAAKQALESYERMNTSGLNPFGMPGFGGMGGVNPLGGPAEAPDIGAQIEAELARSQGAAQGIMPGEVGGIPEIQTQESPTPDLQRYYELLQRSRMSPIGRQADIIKSGFGQMFGNLFGR